MCTSTHDYVHLHAIVSMQLKFSCMHAKAHMNNHMHTEMHVACTQICTQAYVCSPYLSHMHALSSHVTLKDLSSNDEKHLQKTYMLSEVADQRPANSINFKMTLKT